jgi:hypothetical protein
MVPDSPDNLSPDQVYAHKFAVQELAKYYREFSRWRTTRRASEAIDRAARVQAPLGPALKKPTPPEQRSSA